jgi:hypothetical protein
MKNTYSRVEGGFIMLANLAALPRLWPLGVQMPAIKTVASLASATPLTHLPYAVINRLNTKQAFHSSARQNK